VIQFPIFYCKIERKRKKKQTRGVYKRNCVQKATYYQDTKVSKRKEGKRRAET